MIPAIFGLGYSRVFLYIYKGNGWWREIFQETSQLVGSRAIILCYGLGAFGGYAIFGLYLALLGGKNEKKQVGKEEFARRG